MNKWALMALLGGAIYWLTREPAPPHTGTYAGEPDLDPDDDEDLLDEALDESFPASDPPAVTRPTH